MIAGYTLRRATAADAATIRHHRRAMFDDMGAHDAAGLDRMDAAFAGWLDERLADERYVGLFAVDEAGVVVSGVGVWFSEWPPSFHYPRSTRGYILNVYTEPEHRRRGLARWLVQATVDECAARGVGVILLHASDAGRAMYAGLGFKASNEMRLFLVGGP